MPRPSPLKRPPIPDILCPMFAKLSHRGIALTLCLILSPRTALGASVVPPEICVEGDPMQLLSYGQLPLSVVGAKEAARRAGMIQQGGRSTILASFALGTVMTLGGISLTTLGSYQGKSRTAQGGLLLTTLGLGIGIGGVFGGQRLLEEARLNADIALPRERDATGAELRWRTAEEPCANDYFDSY